MDIEFLLENRHSKELEWIEKYPACGPEGNSLDAFVTLRATVHDCINMQRLRYKSLGKETMGNDGVFLQDFIAINWARVV